MTVQITVEGQPPKYLTAPAYTLGRAAECNVRLPENDRLVSREHARLERDEGGRWWIIDLSTNGTFVNGERVSTRRALHDGDQIGIGSSQIAFASAAVPSTVPDQAPSRDAQTITITAGERQASRREGSSRISSGSSAPLEVRQVAPAARASSRVEVTPATPMAPSSAPMPAPLAPDAPRELEAAAPSAGESALASSQGNATGAPPQAEEPMKQCAGCGHLYALRENDCPDCGHSDFRVGGTARVTVQVAEPMTAPATPAPAAPAPVAPAPVAPAPATPAPSLLASATPFDRVAERGKPVQTALPEAPNGVAAADSAPPKPLVPPVGNWPEVNLEDVSFGRQNEPKPGLSRAGLGCGLTMLLSLFLPWALLVAGSVSYAQICKAALVDDSGPASSALLLDSINRLPRMPDSRLLMLLPVFATVVALVAAIRMLGTQRSTARGSALALLCGGTLGLIAASIVRANPNGVGHWIFAAASVGAMVVGLARIASLRPARDR